MPEQQQRDTLCVELVPGDRKAPAY